MKTFGLIGYRLGHSFSRKFFTEKFERENLTGHEYVNFELDSIEEFPGLFERNDHISGLNCTIPYKQQIIPYLDEVREEAAKAGAVNTIKIIREPKGLKLVGYNTDVYGFEHSLRPLLQGHQRKALILGTGGASRAVKYVLDKLNIEYLSATTKAERGEREMPYRDITPALLQEYFLIIQSTPLGMFPNTGTCPDIPYEALTSRHLLYDLVYNPEETLFLQKGAAKGAITKNGLEMLRLQAIKAWEIWHQ